NDWVTMHTKQYPYRTYAIAMRVPAGAVAPGLYWDTADPYHYVRLARNGEQPLLIVGGEDHRTGQQEDGADRHFDLRHWTRQRFPAAGDVEFQWSGQVLEPVDGL